MTIVQSVLITVITLIAILGVVLFVMLFALARSEENLQPPDLGVKEGNLSPCPQTPNCISTQAPREAGTNYAEPIILEEEPARVFEKVRRWIESEPQGRIADVDDARYMRAEFRSKLFGFVDDLELLITREEGRDVLHVRSAARVGKGDMGVNRKRYGTLRAVLGE